MTKILHISDTHANHKLIPDHRFEGIDMVIHSGDCSNYKDSYRNNNEVLDFIEWYKNIPVKDKVYVAGNHDTSIERRLVTPGHFAEAGIHYLEHTATYINGLYIFGSPYTPTYGEWSFMKARDKIGRYWEAIPEGLDVLIVHGPPRGVRDLSYSIDNKLEFCGDMSLLKAVYKTTPKLMCFGHIHNFKDINNQGVSTYSDINTIFSNATCVEDGRFDKGLTSFGNIIDLD